MPLVENRVLERMEKKKWGEWEEGKKEVLRRARWLLPEDRKIVEMVIGAQATARQAAAWAGVPAGTVSRRIARLARRLRDPVVAVLLEERCPLIEEYRQLGIEHFLQGLPERELADKHQMTRHEVCRILQFIRGWQKGISIRRRNV
jgi:hypothetical protein